MISDAVHTVVSLSRLPRIGRARLKSILVQLGPVESDIPPLSNVIDRFRSRFFPDLASSDLTAAQAQADEVVRLSEELRLAIHPFGWSTYPSQLRRLQEPPALLFSKGRFDFDRRPRIAVIGTRKPTDWGLETAAACAGTIATHHGVVISGLALGIDAAAQAASVASSAPTWAVLAHGLHTVSPASNRELAQQILESGGAWVSEYPPGERAQRHYFVERDRIQAGLADAVLVIESGIDGGAMHTVRFANEANVPVWATFPQSKSAVDDSQLLPEQQQGTWELLRAKKATRVSGVKSLERMITDIGETPARPPAPDTLFTQ